MLTSSCFKTINKGYTNIIEVWCKIINNKRQTVQHFFILDGQLLSLVLENRYKQDRRRYDFNKWIQILIIFFPKTQWSRDFLHSNCNVYSLVQSNIPRITKVVLSSIGSASREQLTIYWNIWMTKTAIYTHTRYPSRIYYLLPCSYTRYRVRHLNPRDFLTHIEDDILVLEIQGKHC